jgi:protein SCO1/2
MKRSHLPLLIVAAGAVVLLALLGFGYWRSAGSREAAPQASGAPAPGGPFDLVATDGRRVTDETFRGQWELVYFGYTHCPDVCPTTLSAVAEALDELGRRADSVQPLFITVDPARDTELVLADYVGHFGGRILGLTGTPAEIDKVAHEFGVFVTKHRTGDGAEDYSVDHSASLFVMDPKGRFAGTLGTQTSGAQIAQRLAALISSTS